MILDKKNNEKKKEKEDENNDNKGKVEKTTKTRYEFHGEEFAPTGGPSQFESYSWSASSKSHSGRSYSAPKPD